MDKTRTAFVDYCILKCAFLYLSIYCTDIRELGLECYYMASMLMLSICFPLLFYRTMTRSSTVSWHWLAANWQAFQMKISTMLFNPMLQTCQLFEIRTAGLRVALIFI